MLLVVVLSGGLTLSGDALNDLTVFLLCYLRSAHGAQVRLLQGLKVLFDSETHLEEDLSGHLERALNSPATDSATDLGYALLLLHTHRSKNRHTQGSVLFFSSGEVSALRLIKCAFTARRWSIPINCVLSSGDTLCDLGNPFKGEYFLLPEGSNNAAAEAPSLFEFLIGTLSLGLSDGHGEGLKRRCVCHGKEIKRGHLCPICLSLYCAFVPLCRHCKTKFVF